MLTGQRESSTRFNLDRGLSRHNVLSGLSGRNGTISSGIRIRTTGLDKAIDLGAGSDKIMRLDGPRVLVPAKARATKATRRARARIKKIP